MADNKEEESLDDPIKDQVDITPVPLIETNTPNQEPENMEVHHHAHHGGKKNWKTYFWNF
jgi:hypothetical protein